ncbi:MAG: hypothetical protein ACRDJY_07500 [Thermoleophilaceae bacterium]
MRRAGWIATLAALCLVVGVAGAAVNGKLKGTFNASVRSVEATFPVDSEPVPRTYKFKCVNDGCSSVRFTREGGDGTVKSNLNKVDPGVFKGTERTDTADCPDSGKTSPRFIDHKVTILEVNDNGLAKRIKGKSNYRWPACNGDPTQTTKFSGRRSN